MGKHHSSTAVIAVGFLCLQFHLLKEWLSKKYVLVSNGQIFQGSSEMYLHSLLLLGWVSPYQFQSEVTFLGSLGFLRFFTLLIYMIEGKLSCVNFV